MTLDEVLTELMPQRETTGGASDDELVAAGQEVARRADTGHRAYHSAAYLGAVVVTELREHGMSWREIDKQTGIEATTARRWARRLAAGELLPEPTPKQKRGKR